MKIKGKFSKKTHIDMHTGEVVALMAFPVDMPQEDIEAFLDTSADKWLDISIKESSDGRSLNANSMLWGCLTEIRNFKNKYINKGDPLSLVDVYIEFLSNYGQYVFLQIPPEAVNRLKESYRDVKVLREVDLFEVDEDGNYKWRRVAEVMAYIGSSQYSKAEFSQLLDGVVKYMREHGMTPPPSEEMQMVLEEYERHEKRNSKQ